MGFTLPILPISSVPFGSVSRATVLPVQQSREAVRVGAGAVMEQTSYFAKPGFADRVYEHRLHVSDVRQRMGLPAGRVSRRVGGTGDVPDVIWQLAYSDPLNRVLGARAQSPEFEEVRTAMNTLIDKSTRSSYRPAAR